jgi:hypothetical protein
MNNETSKKDNKLASHQTEEIVLSDEIIVSY